MRLQVPEFDGFGHGAGPRDRLQDRRRRGLFSMQRVLMTIGLMLAAAGATAQTTVPIDVHSAYLHLDPADTANNALAIDLGALGLAPGSTVELAPAGDWDAGPGDDAQTILLGVFSSSATVLAPDLLHRVPGAIDAGTDNFSGGTWPSGQPTDITEDFTIQTPGLSIVIPAGAAYLMVTPADIYYLDNGDPDGDLGVTITRVPTSAVPDDPATLGRLRAAPNPFQAVTTFAFTTGRPGNVRLTLYDVAGRTVRTLVDGELRAGNHITLWDGRDAAGQTLSAGIYFAHIRSADQRTSVRVVRTE